MRGSLWSLVLFGAGVVLFLGTGGHLFILTPVAVALHSWPLAVALLSVLTLMCVLMRARLASCALLFLAASCLMNYALRTTNSRGRLMLGELPGLALITESTSATGKLVAATLVDAGWQVIMHGKTLECVKKAAQEMNELRPGGQPVVLSVAADLSDMAQIEQLAQKVIRHPSSSRLSLLVLNAGALGASSITNAGYDSSVQVNFLSGAILQQRLSHFVEANRGRVVHVSSGFHLMASSSIQENLAWTRASVDLANYGRSRLLQIAFAKESARHTSATVVSVDPGLCSAEVTRDDQLQRRLAEWTLLPRFLHPWLAEGLSWAHRISLLPPRVCADAVLHASAAGVPSGSHLRAFHRETGALLYPALANEPQFCARVYQQVLEAASYTQERVRDSALSLERNGYFLVRQVHTGDRLALLRRLALNLPGSQRDVFKSVFGDQQDLVKFPENHPRNVLGRLKMSFVGRSDLPAPFEEIYADSVMLNFLERVVTTTSDPYPSLHLSSDKEGSLYVFTGVDGDAGEIHVDQHPFSCVHMLSKPDKGGELILAHYPPTKAHDGTWQWNWDVLADIQAGSETYLKRVVADEGDMYCFRGNMSFHATGAIQGEKMRAIIVAAYSPESNFVHSEHVHALNNWGTKKRHLDACLGSKDCLKTLGKEDL